MKTCLHLILPLLFLCSWNQMGSAQGHDVDELFEEARTIAYDGNYSEARRICRLILEEAPGYHDVRVFIARTYAWQNRFTDARRELQMVLDENPNNNEALTALIDVERWSDNPGRALAIADRALDQYPTDVELLIRRTEVLIRLEQSREAASALNRVDSLSPGNQRVRELRQRLGTIRLLNTFEASYTYDLRPDHADPWQRLTLQYMRRTGIGPLFGRLNLDDRFDTTGLQFELDFYPRLSTNWYSYLNAGYSDSDIFPSLRFGGDLYRTLRRGWEVSFGARYLDFGNDQVVIGTGSVGKFTGSWFFQARPFIGSGPDSISRSLTVLVRRYFGQPLTFLTFRGGVGYSPDERPLTGLLDEVQLNRSHFAGIEFYKLLRPELQMFSELRFTSQSAQTDSFSNTYTFSLGLKYSF